MWNRKKYIIIVGMYLTIFLAGYMGKEAAADVENADIQKEEILEQGEGDFHRYTNDENLYYGTDKLFGKGFIERRLDGTKERKIKIKHFREVFYVDNDWVYYSKFNPGNSIISGRIEFWKMPIEEEAEGRKVNSKKAERIYKEKKGYTSIYCDGRYLVYLNLNHIYQRYDILEKVKIPLPEEIKKAEGKRNWDYMDHELKGIYGNSVFVNTGTKSWRIDLDSNQAEKICEEEIFDTAYSKDGILYYEQGTFGDLGTIYQYNLKSHSTEKFITKEEIKNLLIQEGFWDKSWKKKGDFYIDDIFYIGERLYLQVHIQWHLKKTRYENMLFCSKEGNTTGELCLEKELSAVLKNPKKNQKKFVKLNNVAAGIKHYQYLSRGLCIAMTEEDAYFLLYNPEKKKNMFATYNLETKEFSYLSREDEKYYRLYYDYYDCYEWTQRDNNNWKTYFFYMPNNKSWKRW